MLINSWFALQNYILDDSFFQQQKVISLSCISAIFAHWRVEEFILILFIMASTHHLLQKFCSHTNFMRFKISNNYLWKVMAIMGGSWGLEESRHDPCCQDGWSGELQASQPHLSPWKGMEKILLETLSKHMKDKKVTGSSHNWFMKEKTNFASLMAFYGEIWWPWGMEEEQQVSFILTLWESFDNIP